MSTSMERKKFWAERAHDPRARDPIYRVALGVLQGALDYGPITQGGLEAIAARLVAELRRKVPGLDAAVSADQPNSDQRGELRREAAESAGSKVSVGEDELYTVSQAAEMLGLSRDRIYDLLESRGLGRRIGKRLVVSGADIEAMRERRPGRPAKNKDV